MKIYDNIIACILLRITIVLFKFDINHLGVSLSYIDTVEVNGCNAVCVVGYTIDDTGRNVRREGQAIVEEIRILSLLLEVSPFQFRDLNTTFELTVYVPKATSLLRVFQ